MELNVNEVWSEIKSKIKSEVDSDVYESYFESINQIYKDTGKVIYLVVDNMFLKNRIENVYLNKMNSMLSEYYGQDKTFLLITRNEIAEKEEKEKNLKEAINFTRTNSSGLNPAYTFSTFVVGDSNRMAHRYAILASEQQAEVSNPVYFFGDVGLGKTHLMQAIGNAILENKPELNVLYIRTQDFSEDYLKAGKNNYEGFSDKFYNVDVLLVDDIQFLEGRTKTQIEFFKIFERLHNDKKLIVITSDRKAAELPLMSRLTSRFEWGMSIDLDKPSKEHRINILKIKLKQLTADPDKIPLDVLDFIATACDSNVRELEGALKRFLFYCEAFGTSYDLENAKDALQNYLSISSIPGTVTTSNEIKKILDVVSSYFKFSIDALMSTARKKELVYARQLCFYIMKNNYGMTFQKIGDIFGGKDHSTIMHGYSIIENELSTSEETKKNIENILRKLGKSSNEV